MIAYSFLHCEFNLTNEWLNDPFILHYTMYIMKSYRAEYLDTFFYGICILRQSLVYVMSYT